ncbi:putative Zinc finger, CCHC-type superfamily [Helianthus debilis subsp. tardiflorus]
MSASNTSVVQLSTATHFPIRLTANNFPCWRKQILSTLTGLELEQYIDGLTEPPPKLLEGKPNPEYRIWYRQDQILLGALLGSCSDTIQPLVSSAETSHQLFTRLTASYASVSRSRILSLRTKLATTTKGNRRVTEYLHEMKAIADELALAQKPIDDDDLTAHILAHLGEDYKEMAAVLKNLHTTITFSDLYEKLVDHERTLLENKPMAITTVNQTQRHPNNNTGRFSSRPNTMSRYQNRPNYSGPRNTNSAPHGQPSNFRTNRNNLFCQFCTIPGHDTKECRKFARFLQQNNLALAQPASTPQVNVSMAAQQEPSLMFDSGASDHATPDQAFVHTLSEYGGPDEIVLGNGSSHGGATLARGEH